MQVESPAASVPTESKSNVVEKRAGTEASGYWIECSECNAQLQHDTKEAIVERFVDGRYKCDVCRNSLAAQSRSVCGFLLHK